MRLFSGKYKSKRSKNKISTLAGEGRLAMRLQWSVNAPECLQTHEAFQNVDLFNFPFFSSSFDSS